MATFEARVARAGMDETEIRKFVGDFTGALIDASLTQTHLVDEDAANLEHKFDEPARFVDWADPELLASAGIEARWIAEAAEPHRIFMHPDFVTCDVMWDFVSEYIEISMVSEKQSRILFPNLMRKLKPSGVAIHELLQEARLLNGYLRRVQKSGLKGSRVAVYRGDLRTHGQGQNVSGKIGSVGAAVAIRDALLEISPHAIADVYGAIPKTSASSPVDIATQMKRSGYIEPKAILLSNQRAIVFSSNPDVAVLVPVGGDNFGSAHQAADQWGTLRSKKAASRSPKVYQVAFGEVKTALDRQNLTERMGLAARENQREVQATRFLFMAMLTKDILDPDREGGNPIFSRIGQRFEEVFNLYFTWGYDGARSSHPEHWEDFKSALKRWADL